MKVQSEETKQTSRLDWDMAHSLELSDRKFKITMTNRLRH